LIFKDMKVTDEIPHLGEYSIKNMVRMNIREGAG